MICLANPLKLRFSIRALLVLMALLSLFFWYHINWIRQRRELIESGEVFSDSDSPVRAPGILSLFGEAGYAEIFGGASADETEVQVGQRLAKLFPEAEISVEIYCPPESFTDSDEVLP